MLPQVKFLTKNTYNASDSLFPLSYILWGQDPGRMCKLVSRSSLQLAVSLMTLLSAELTCVLERDLCLISRQKISAPESRDQEIPSRAGLSPPAGHCHQHHAAGKGASLLPAPVLPPAYARLTLVRARDQGFLSFESFPMGQ